MISAFCVARSKGRKDEEKEVKRTLGPLDSLQVAPQFLKDRW